MCADVVDVVVTSRGDGRFRFEVTVLSPDTGWEKYADQWVVRSDGDGATVLVTRVLAHPHVDEQPFTRSELVQVPADIDHVVVAARDSVAGFCGETMRVDVPK